MIRIQYTNKSTHRIVLPYKTQKHELLTLAQAFVAPGKQPAAGKPHPLHRQHPNGPDHALATQAASAAQEVSRKSASETLKRLDAAARTAVGQIGA